MTLDTYNIKKLSKQIKRLYPDKTYNINYNRYTNKIEVTINL